MAGKIENLSSVDAAWLKMEDPTNLMMVSGVLTFDKPVDVDRLRALVATRMLQFDRFRQRVVDPLLPLAPPYWKYDANFSLDAHVHRIDLPYPGDKAALQELVSDLMSTALDLSKPPWQIHIVDGYGEGGAIIVRLHHCIADGMALVGVLLAMTDMTADAPAPDVGDVNFDSGSRGLIPGSLKALRQRGGRVVRAGVHVGRRTLIEGLETYLNHDNVRRMAEDSSDYAHAMSKLVLRSADPDTILKGDLGVAKRAAWSRPLPLAEAKAISKATGATINDVMTTAITGGLRAYMELRGEDVDDMIIRAAVPVNLRTSDEMGELGNKFGLVFLDLPVGAPTTKARLKLVQQRMSALKDSAEAPVALDILAGMGLSPQLVQDLVVHIIGQKATTVLTNVPGPPIPLYLAGQRIENIMFWVPQSGRLGLGISILSYAGNICLGIATDAGLIPDPDAVMNCVYLEYDNLLEMAS